MYLKFFMFAKFFCFSLLFIGLFNNCSKAPSILEDPTNPIKIDSLTKIDSLNNLKDLLRFITPNNLEKVLFQDVSINLNINEWTFDDNRTLSILNPHNNKSEDTIVVSDATVRVNELMRSKIEKIVSLGPVTYYFYLDTLSSKSKEYSFEFKYDLENIKLSIIQKEGATTLYEYVWGDTITVINKKSNNLQYKIVPTIDTSSGFITKVEKEIYRNGTSVNTLSYTYPAEGTVLEKIEANDTTFSFGYNNNTTTVIMETGNSSIFYILSNSESTYVQTIIEQTDTIQFDSSLHTIKGNYKNFTIEGFSMQKSEVTYDWTHRIVQIYQQHKEGTSNTGGGGISFEKD